MSFNTTALEAKNNFPLSTPYSSKKTKTLRALYTKTAQHNGNTYERIATSFKNFTPEEIKNRKFIATIIYICSLSLARFFKSYNTYCKATKRGSEKTKIYLKTDSEKAKILNAVKPGLTKFAIQSEKVSAYVSIKIGTKDQPSTQTFTQQFNLKREDGQSLTPADINHLAERIRTELYQNPIFDANCLDDQQRLEFNWLAIGVNETNGEKQVMASIVDGRTVSRNGKFDMKETGESTPQYYSDRKIVSAHATRLLKQMGFNVTLVTPTNGINVTV